MTITEREAAADRQADAERQAELANLRRLVRQFDALLGPEVTPHAAVDADGTPGLVATGELIEAAWGNAVANNVDAFKRGMPASTGPYYGAWPAAGWPQVGMLIRSGHVAVTTSSYGDAAFTFPYAFPNGVCAVVMTALGGDGGGIQWYPTIRSVNLTTCQFWAMSHQGAPYAGGHPPSQPGIWTIANAGVTLDYIAIGV